MFIQKVELPGNFGTIILELFGDNFFKGNVVWLIISASCYMRS